MTEIDVYTSAERLRKVADVINANPEHFDMSGWVGDDLMDSEEFTSASHWGLAKTIAQSDVVSCGTTACVAGWALQLWPAEVPDHCSISQAAQRVLGLDENESFDVFFAHCHGDAIGHAYESGDQDTVRRLVTEKLHSLADERDGGQH